MGWTGDGKFGCKLKRASFNLKYKTTSKGGKINNDLIEYVTKKHFKKK